MTWDACARVAGPGTCGHYLTLAQVTTSVRHTPATQHTHSITGPERNFLAKDEQEHHYFATMFPEHQYTLWIHLTNHAPHSDTTQLSMCNIILYNNNVTNFPSGQLVGQGCGSGAVSGLGVAPGAGLSTSSYNTVSGQWCTSGSLYVAESWAGWADYADRVEWPILLSSAQVNHLMCNNLRYTRPGPNIGHCTALTQLPHLTCLRTIHDIIITHGGSSIFQNSLLEI